MLLLQRAVWGVPTNLASFTSSLASISLTPEEGREQGQPRTGCVLSSLESVLTKAGGTVLRAQEELLQKHGSESKIEILRGEKWICEGRLGGQG